MIGNNHEGAGWRIRTDDGQIKTTTNVVFDESSRFGREEESVRPGLEFRGLTERSRRRKTQEIPVPRGRTIRIR